VSVRAFGPDCHLRGPYALRTCTHRYTLSPR
jgi:hypothetical protein